jgi:hypothetical protein
MTAKSFYCLLLAILSSPSNTKQHFRGMILKESERATNAFERITDSDCSDWFDDVGATEVIII